MKLVKRRNDPVIALLIILLALEVRFTFQKIFFITVSTPAPEENQSCPPFRKYPLTSKGIATFNEGDKPS